MRRAMVSIRSAEVQDAAAIAHVHVQSWLTTYAGVVPAEYLASLNVAERIPLWQDWLQRDLCVHVAELEGVVVGFASGGPIREPLGEYKAEMYAIYLLRSAQGDGIGRQLVSALATTLLAKDFTNMLVWVLEQNPAVRFYEKAGAQHLESKQIEMGGVSLSEMALGWSDLRQLVLKTAFAD
jgi:L-amino acid N-acyltransferase YncA